MEWEANNPQPEIAEFIWGFFGAKLKVLVDAGQQPDPIIGFSALRRIQLIEIAEAYGLNVGEDGVFSGSTPHADIVKIMEVMYAQGKFKQRVQADKAGDWMPDLEKPGSGVHAVNTDVPDYAGMSYRELQAAAKARNITSFGVKQPELIAALNA